MIFEAAPQCTAKNSLEVNDWLRHHLLFAWKILLPLSKIDRIVASQFNAFYCGTIR